MATGLEIERKFKVDRKKLFDEIAINSELLHAYNCSRLITQHYVLDKNGVELRVREIDFDDDDRDSTKVYYMTAKKKTEHSFVREETEVQITQDVYELLKSVSHKGLLKMRFKTKINGLTWEVDVFLGEALRDLALAEVEFDDVEAAEKLTEFPCWVEHEITDDDLYKNSSLAIHGWGVEDKDESED